MFNLIVLLSTNLIHVTFVKSMFQFFQCEVECNSTHCCSAGHFTQVVWKESSELGVGLATDGKTAFVVGQYRTAGNMTNPGYFEANVLQGNTLQRCLEYCLRRIFYTLPYKKNLLQVCISKGRGGKCIYSSTVLKYYFVILVLSLSISI